MRTRLALVVVALIGTLACSGTPAVRSAMLVNYTCLGTSEVKTVRVSAYNDDGARWIAVAQVERLCGIGWNKYTIGRASAEAK